MLAEWDDIAFLILYSASFAILWWLSAVISTFLIVLATLSTACWRIGFGPVLPRNDSENNSAYIL